MSETVIKVENLSKQYRLGTVGTGTLRSDVQRFWANLTGKEDPTLKIGQVNSLANNEQQTTNNDYVWALKDINFEVKQGEVLGIIGKNGAGKSTLLKILSQVTTPSTGNVKVKGRIASLLEVGTGFHPELTGRENIFLNGAILGMTKAEIRSKFDEIVDFAGIAKYIDTPVKRYSSGMYVRLAFAVAAHLEPEILIVDEVLAVGDAEFQKKALGKMQQISHGQGRTVLFVSHNMASIKSICSTGIILTNGGITFAGGINEAVSNYINEKNKIIKSLAYHQKDNRLTINKILINGLSTNNINLQNKNTLNVHFEGYISADLNINMEARIYNYEFTPLAFFSPGHIDGYTKLYTKGSFHLDYIIELPSNMNKGSFLLSIALTDPGKQVFGALESEINISYDGICTKSGLVFDSNKSGWLLLNKLN